ncbi:MAG: hypothetical protein KGR98_01945 [Verrucomicrobia bacterium]|nr:hypothetical protein [Verrucomicrobiota bacterium]
MQHFSDDGLSSRVRIAAARQNGDYVGRMASVVEELDFIINYDIKYRLGRETEIEEDERSPSKPGVF